MDTKQIPIVNLDKIHDFVILFWGEKIKINCFTSCVSFHQTCLTIEAVVHSYAGTSLMYVFPYSTLLQFSLISITLNGPISTYIGLYCIIPFKMDIAVYRCFIQKS